MKKDDIMQRLYNSIIELDNAMAIEMAKAVIDENLNITEIIERSMSPAMDEIGKGFQSGERFLPELQMSADIFSAAMAILKPRLIESKGDIKSSGRILIGTVKGDMHSIGKELVATMLNISGFEVTDLGVDIPTFTFLEQAEKTNADIIALSALLTTTMPAQREVIEALESQNLRGRYKVIIGGAPVSKKWADEIGADGYGKNAIDAVELVKALSPK